MRVKSRYIGLRVTPTLANQITQAVTTSGQNQADWLRHALNDAIHTNALLTVFTKTLEEMERRIIARLDRVDAALTTLEVMDAPTHTTQGE